VRWRERELRRLAREHGAELRRLGGGSHYRLRLPNGLEVTASAMPGC
jgi:hypothetical protein